MAGDRVKNIQALIDRGWILKVSKNRDVWSDMNYLADISNPEPQMNECGGHAHFGRTVETALLQLDDYVAAQGKSEGTK
jgi:hypothetical protein